MPTPTLSIVVPCYNEQESIHACHEKLTQVLSAPDRVRLRRDLRTLVYSAMTESFA